MREIKFRAWEIEHKKMMPVFQMTNVNIEKRVITTLINSKDGLGSYCGINFELMQYTGLKDKNGKEIYEGDILERIGTRDNFSEVPMDTLSRELVVAKLDVIRDQFGTTSSGFSLHTQQTYSERSNPATYEIIGNIYENPELLEK